MAHQPGCPTCSLAGQHTHRGSPYLQGAAARHAAAVSVIALQQLHCRLYGLCATGAHVNVMQIILQLLNLAANNPCLPALITQHRGAVCSCSVQK